MIANAHGYYFFEIRNGSDTCAVGFPNAETAQEWMDGMLDVAGNFFWECAS